jgi:hypothetical protein
MSPLNPIDPQPSTYGLNTKPLISILETPSTEKLSPPPSSSSSAPTLPLSATTNPCSAFYTHPPTRHSLEQLALKKESGSQVRIYEEDLEGLAGRRSSVEPSKLEERVWPGRNKRCGCEKRKGCTRKGCLGRLSKRERLIVKVALGMVLVGAMVGLGVGIAKAVGGGVWAGQNNQVDVGHTGT